MKPQETLLKTGENVWCQTRADRAAVLIDAAEYFGALRQAMLNARHTIQIVGWDVDSRTNLVGPGGCATDGLPPALGDFLDALVARRPELRIRILLWDYSLFFANEREPLPTVALRWKRPPQIDLCLDDSVPYCASHHQKIVVIDDNLAFAGGLDLTVRRWDDCRHRYFHRRRIDPGGEHYGPFHDVQMMVDGEAAHRLGELARRRWAVAACESCAPSPALPAAWPEDVTPHFRDVTIGIARTQPAGMGAAGAAVNEVEQLFIDMIGRAKRSLYIESQYLTYLPVARAIAERLAADPLFEAILICPRKYHGRFERQAMLSGRADFVGTLQGAAAGDRWIVAAPCSCDQSRRVDISLHSKVMIVDDRYLRIGSANLCNRSMGTDTECDLVIVASNDRHEAAIAALRNRLLAEHSGIPFAAFAANAEDGGSVVGMLQADTRKLVPIDREADARQATFPIVKVVADPLRPLSLDFPWTQRKGRQGAGWLGPTPQLLLGAAVLVALAALSVWWAVFPVLGEDDLRQPVQWIAGQEEYLAGLAVVGLFLAGGAMAFPLILLVLATTALFGIWPGIAYAAAGAMLSAGATYMVGRWIGHALLRKFLGPRLNRIAGGFAERGILAVTAVRLLPIAPFTLVNLAAGALRIPVLDYFIGTFVGFLPGFAMIGLAGHQASELLRNPTPLGVGLLGLLLALSIGCSVLLQRGMAIFRSRSTQ